MIVETSAVKHVSISAAAGLSWAVALTSSIQATLDQSTLIPIGLAVTALGGAILLTWKAARYWSRHMDHMERIDERLDRIEKAQDPD